MGVCRQDDVAFKHLTIYEHLEYFARIKVQSTPDIVKIIFIPNFCQLFKDFTQLAPKV